MAWGRQTTGGSITGSNSVASEIVKLSISIPAEDVAILDEHAKKAGLGSRSAAVHAAIRVLRHSELEDDYAAAWEDWERSGDRASWETTSADGLA